MLVEEEKRKIDDAKKKLECDIAREEQQRFLDLQVDHLVMVSH